MPNFASEIMTAAFDEVKKGDLTSQIKKKTTFYDIFTKSGAIKTFNSGEYIRVPLVKAESQYDRFEGADSLGIDQPSILDTAQYRPAQVAVHYSFTGREALLMSKDSDLIADIAH